MDTFLETQREEVFSNVAVCVYVFDVESGGFLGDLSAFERVCNALGELNRVAGRSEGSEKGRDGKEGAGCRVWVCVHKMDLVKNLGVIPGAEGEPSANGHRKTVGEKRFEEKCAEISKRAGAFAESVEFFGTSIWDQSLYRAWTRIIYHLIPNAVAIENMLGKLTKVIGERECTLFERTTCLTIASSIGKGFGDMEGEGEDFNPVEGRGEMMSGILKSWKQSLSCVAIEIPLKKFFANMIQPPHQHTRLISTHRRLRAQDRYILLLHHQIDREHQYRCRHAAIRTVSERS